MLDIYDEALAVHEALRRLGYKSDWIFVACTDGVFEVILHIPMMPVCAIIVGPIDPSDKDCWNKKWDEKVEWWRTLDNDRCMELYLSSNVLKNDLALIQALIAHGLYPLDKVQHRRN